MGRLQLSEDRAYRMRSDGRRASNPTNRVSISSLEESVIIYYSEETGTFEVPIEKIPAFQEHTQNLMPRIAYKIVKGKYIILMR